MTVLLSLQSVFLYPLTTVKHLTVRITGTQTYLFVCFVFVFVFFFFDPQLKEEQEKPACMLSPNAACLGTEFFVDGETCLHLGPSTLRAVLSKRNSL